MDIATTIKQILATHEGKGVRPAKTDVSRWHVTTPGLFSSRRKRENVKACKLKILAAFAESNEVVFLVPPEDPSEDEVTGKWRQVSENTWIVPRDFDPQEWNNTYWHYLGGWILYVPKTALPLPESYWKQKSKVFVADPSVAVMIDSFYDNLEWTITFGSDVPQ